VGTAITVSPVLLRPARAGADYGRVTVTGSGFPKGDAVVIILVAAAEGEDHILLGGDANASGAFRFTGPPGTGIPGSFKAGVYSLLARSQSGVSASTALELGAPLPPPTPTPLRPTPTPTPTVVK